MDFFNKIKDGYYSVEDKWFDFLDFLDGKHIPIYKVIDPIEKTGVPSLPVFVVLLLVISYFALGGFILPSSHDFTMKVVYQNNPSQGVIGANIALESNGKDVELLDSKTKAEGKLLVTLKKGDYKVTASYTDCTTATKDITVDDLTDTEKIELECFSSEKTKIAKTICFTGLPSGAESVTAIVYDKDSMPENTIECGKVGSEILCENFNIEDEKEYYFETETSSSQSLVYDDLSSIDKSLGKCVTMTQKDVVSSSKINGTIHVLLKDKITNKSITSADVELIDASGEISYGTKKTDGTGKATFSLVNGTKFKVFIPATALINEYTSIQDYTSTEGTQTILIQTTQGTPTQIITMLETERVENAYIKIFNGEDVISDGFTTIDGFNFSGEKLKTYRATVHKEGYKDDEINITTGEIKEVQMSRIDIAKTGEVQVNVYIDNAEKAPVEDVTVRLFKCEDDSCAEIAESSHPEKVTDSTGKIEFNWVEPGDYCVDGARNGEMPTLCSDSKFKVTAGTIAKTGIKIAPYDYKITVTVVMPDNSSPKGPVDVELQKSSGWTKEQIESKKTGTDGKVEFDIEEGNYYYLKADFTTGGKSYPTLMPVGMLAESKDVLLVLAQLETGVSIDNIYLNDKTTPAGDVLESGKKYYIGVNIGLPNVTEERWESVQLNLQFPRYNDGYYAEFENFIMNEMDRKLVKSISDDDDTGDESVKIVILADEYEPTESSAIIYLPFHLTGNFNGTKVYTTNVTATWKSGNKEIIKTDEKRFSVTRVEYSSENYEVNLEIGTGSGANVNFGEMATFVITGLEKTLTLRIEVTNKQDSPFNKIMNVKDEFGHTEFKTITGAKGKTTTPYGIKSDKKEAEVSFEFGSDNIAKNETVAIDLVVMTKTGTSGGKTYIPVYMDDELVAQFEFGIDAPLNGMGTVELSPETLDEFTDELEITLEDNKGKKIDASEIIDIKLYSSLTMETTECSLSNGMIKTGTGNGEYLVNLSEEECAINTMQNEYATAKLVIESATYGFNEISVNTKTCFKLEEVSEIRTSAKVDKEYLLPITDTCSESISVSEIKVDTSIDDSDFYLYNGYADDDVTDRWNLIEGELGDIVKTDNKGFIKGIPIVVNYDYNQPTDFNIEIISFYVESDSGIKRIYEFEDIPVKITNYISLDDNAVSKLDFFKPMAIAPYTESPDCSRDYCSLEQVAMFIQDETENFTKEVNHIYFNMIAIQPYLFEVAEMLEKKTSIKFDVVSSAESGYAIVNSKELVPGRNQFSLKASEGTALLTLEPVEGTELEMNAKNIQALLYYAGETTTKLKKFTTVNNELSGDNSAALEEMITTNWAVSEAAISDSGWITFVEDDECSDTNDLACEALQAKLGDKFNARQITAGLYVKDAGNGKYEVHLAGTRPALYSYLLESITGALKVDDTKTNIEILVTKGNVLTFGEKEFAANASDGLVEMTYSQELRDAMKNLAIKQYSIDSSISSKVKLKDGRLGFMNILRCGSACDNEYRDIFENSWNGHNLTDTTVMGWKDNAFGITLAAVESEDLECLVNVWAGSGSCQNFEKSSETNTVYKYESIDVSVLRERIIKKLGEVYEGNPYSVIVKTTDKTDCWDAGTMTTADLDATVYGTQKIHGNNAYMITIALNKTGNRDITIDKLTDNAYKVNLNSNVNTVGTKTAAQEQCLRERIIQKADNYVVGVWHNQPGLFESDSWVAMWFSEKQLADGNTEYFWNPIVKATKEGAIHDISTLGYDSNLDGKVDTILAAGVEYNTLEWSSDGGIDSIGQDNIEYLILKDPIKKDDYEKRAYAGKETRVVIRKAVSGVDTNKDGVIDTPVIVWVDAIGDVIKKDGGFWSSSWETVKGLYDDTTDSIKDIDLKLRSEIAWFSLDKKYEESSVESIQAGFTTGIKQSLADRANTISEEAVTYDTNIIKTLPIDYNRDGYIDSVAVAYASNNIAGSSDTFQILILQYDETTKKFKQIDNNWFGDDAEISDIKTIDMVGMDFFDATGTYGRQDGVVDTPLVIWFNEPTMNNYWVGTFIWGAGTGTSCIDGVSSGDLWTKCQRTTKTRGDYFTSETFSGKITFMQATAFDRNKDGNIDSAAVIGHNDDITGNDKVGAMLILLDVNESRIPSKSEFQKDDEGYSLMTKKYGFGGNTEKIIQENGVTDDVKGNAVVSAIDTNNDYVPDLPIAMWFNEKGGFKNDRWTWITYDSETEKFNDAYNNAYLKRNKYENKWDFYKFFNIGVKPLGTNPKIKTVPYDGNGDGYADSIFTTGVSELTATEIAEATTIMGTEIVVGSAIGVYAIGMVGIGSGAIAGAVIGIPFGPEASGALTIGGTIVGGAGGIIIGGVAGIATPIITYVDLMFDSDGVSTIIMDTNASKGEFKEIPKVPTANPTKDVPNPTINIFPDKSKDIKGFALQGYFKSP